MREALITGRFLSRFLRVVVPLILVSCGSSEGEPFERTAKELEPGEQWRVKTADPDAIACRTAWAFQVVNRLILEKDEVGLNSLMRDGRNGCRSLDMIEGSEFVVVSEGSDLEIQRPRDPEEATWFVHWEAVTVAEIEGIR